MISAETLIKAAVYLCGFLATGWTFVRFVVSVPVKINDITPEEEDMDLVMKVNLKSIKKDKNDQEKQDNKEANETTTAVEERDSELQQKALKYMLEAFRSTGLIVRKRKDTVLTDDESLFYLIGAKEEVLMKGADEMEMKREANDGEWKTYKAQSAADFAPAFESGERIRILHHLLDTAATGAEADQEQVLPYPFLQDDIILRRATNMGLVETLFPLHDDKEKSVLMSTWIKSVKAQPLDRVRNYYGDDVGFYFAFLGFYTRALLFPCIMGVLVFMYQSFYGTENLVTAVYALSVTIWATAFLEFWKRRESELAWRWGVLDLEDVEHERPQFEGIRAYDDIEERYVTSFTHMQRTKRYLVTIPILCGTLLGVMIVTFVFFRLEALASDFFTEANGYGGYWEFLSMLPTIGYSVAVMLMDMYFLDLAGYLNKHENHRTETEYSNALVMKLALFYFINNFGLLFYIAFFTQDFELLQQTLSSLLITRQVVGNVQETLIPFIMAGSSLKASAGMAAVSEEKATVGNKDKETKSEVKEESAIESSKITKEAAIVSRVDAQMILGVYEGTFDDYLEMFVQFGQVTLFAAAYPLAALCSLANNVIEIRSDGFKLCMAHQRPNPVTCKGIGTWLSAFEVLGYVAVLTNCALIGFYSGQLEKLFPSLSAAGTIFIIFGLEHVFILLKIFLEVLVPDVPSSVLDEQKRERVAMRKLQKAQEALEHTEQKRGHAVVVGRHDLEVRDFKEKLNEKLQSNDSTSPALVATSKAGTTDINSAELEAEIQNLSKVYMRWIADEQKRRQQLELQVKLLEKQW